MTQAEHQRAQGILDVLFNVTRQIQASYWSVAWCSWALACTLNLHYIFQSLQLADRIYCCCQQYDDTSRGEKREEKACKSVCVWWWWWWWWWGAEIYCHLYPLLSGSNQWVLLTANANYTCLLLERQPFICIPPIGLPKKTWQQTRWSPW